MKHETLKPIHRAALDFAKRGFDVFPVGRNKKPILTKKRQGTNWGKTTDRQKINKHFGEMEIAGLGVATGKLIGVDLDVKNGVDAVKWWEQTQTDHLEPFNETPCAKTPSGGQHHYFLAADDFEIRNSQSELAPGVDIRGVGGFMVLPPSKTAKGVYEWIVSPDEADFQPLPKSLADKLREIEAGRGKKGRPTNKERDTRELTELIEAMRVKGQGHDAVLRYSAKCAATGVPREYCEAVVAANAHSGLDENAKKTIAGAYEKFAKDFNGDDDFLKGLDQTKKKEIFVNTTNAVRVLKTMPGIAGVRVVNELNGQPLRDPERTVWTDEDDVNLISDVQSFERRDNEGNPVYPLAGFGPETLRLAMKAASPRVQPIAEMIYGLPEWDGQPRIDTLLHYAFGVEDTPLTREYSRRFLIGMIARGLVRAGTPGVQMDTVLCLIGKQGIGKSTFCAWLATDEFFTDQLPDVRDEAAAATAINGRWIVELSEGDLIGRTRSEQLKGFLTRRVDKYRPKYMRNIEEYVRSCVFLMPTNNSEILRDVTGSRRFWPVEVTKKFNKDDFDREQILSEALAAYNQGEPWFLTDEQEAAREEASIGFREGNDMVGEIAPLLVNVPEGQLVTVAELMGELELDGHANSTTGRAIRSAMQWLRWKYQSTRVKTGFVRVPESQPPVGADADMTRVLGREFKPL